MRISILLLLISFIAQAEEVIEEVTTQVLTPTISDNLLPSLIEFATSGDATMTGNTGYCSPGEACTGAAGGTYSTTVDLTETMTIEEINRGFDLAYGVSTTSHSSNAVLPTCDQTSGDCQDNFNLTLTLTENDEVRQTYEHEFVLDYSGLREYEFEQTVVSNSWVELSMLLELYGQDAGYPTGLYGPQFTDPWLTTSYNAISYITEQIVTIVQDDMDDVVEEILEEIVEEPEPEMVLEEPELEVIAELEPEVIAEPEPEIIIEIEPEPEEDFIDAEELFSNPVLAEVVGAADTTGSDINIEITIADPESGEIIDSFEVDFETETIQEIDTGGGFDDMTSLDSFDDLAGFEDMGMSDDMGMPDDFAGSGSETTEMSFAEVLDELPEIDVPDIELDIPEPESMEVAEVNVPEVSEPEPMEIEMAESEPEVVEVEVAESEPEVVEMTESEPEPEVEVAEAEPESTEVEAESEPEVEVAEAEEESETEVAEAEEESEPEAAGAEEERPEPTRVASRSESSDKKAEAKTETSKEKSEKSSRKQKTKRIAKKIATRVMGHLSRNYDAAMQGAALSVMRLSAPSYKATELQDLQEWYTPVQMDGGENHDHPASMWFSAQANQDMSELVKLQWRK